MTRRRRSRKRVRVKNKLRRDVRPDPQLKRNRITRQADIQARIAFKQLQGQAIRREGGELAHDPLVELAQELGQIAQQGEL
jgi:hypothetical protein